MNACVVSYIMWSAVLPLSTSPYHDIDMGVVISGSWLIGHVICLCLCVASEEDVRYQTADESTRLSLSGMATAVLP